MTGLSIVIVHYHTPALAAEAVAAVRRETPSRAGAEVIVVDNGSTPEGAEVLRGLDATIVTAAVNHGYAAGINLGLSRATGTDVVVMNADVIVGPGCFDALQLELRNGAAVAGPAFHWDRDGRLLLPPTERRDTTSQVLTQMSRRGATWARQARRRWRRHARRHWSAASSLDSKYLSGALLAFRRDVWDAIGPFDEAFRLYFEETDWLERISRRGWTTRYVPAARAHHLYDRSARQHREATTWFAESAREFDRRYSSPRVSEWITRLDRCAGDTVPEHVPAGVWAGAPQASVHTPGTWIEISSGAAGYPAASERMAHASHWSMPADLWDHLSPGGYALRVVSEDGDELSAETFRR
jgi:N-acetylglucosaminyl-diphospho-decaprenol L-rhamnosyltransferase